MRPAEMSSAMSSAMFLRRVPCEHYPTWAYLVFTSTPAILIVPWWAGIGITFGLWLFLRR